MKTRISHLLKLYLACNCCLGMLSQVENIKKIVLLPTNLSLVITEEKKKRPRTSFDSLSCFCSVLNVRIEIYIISSAVK